MGTRLAVLLHALEIHVRMHWVVSRRQKRPVLNMMICINKGKDSPAYMSYLIAAGERYKLEIYRFSIVRGLSNHLGGLPKSQ
jgi:hypothetical protein